MPYEYKKSDIIASALTSPSQDRSVKIKVKTRKNKNSRFITLSF
jgi:hypothetical protein